MFVVRVELEPVRQQSNWRARTHTGTRAHARVHAHLLSFMSVRAQCGGLTAAAVSQVILALVSGVLYECVEALDLCGHVPLLLHLGLLHLDHPEPAVATYARSLLTALLETITKSYAPTSAGTLKDNKVVILEHLGSWHTVGPWWALDHFLPRRARHAPGPGAAFTPEGLCGTEPQTVAEHALAQFLQMLVTFFSDLISGEGLCVAWRAEALRWSCGCTGLHHRTLSHHVWRQLLPAVPCARGSGGMARGIVGLLDAVYHALSHAHAFTRDALSAAGDEGPGRPAPADAGDAGPGTPAGGPPPPKIGNPLSPGAPSQAKAAACPSVGAAAPPKAGPHAAPAPPSPAPALPPHSGSPQYRVYVSLVLDAVASLKAVVATLTGPELTLFPAVAVACVGLLYSPDLPVYLCGLDLFAVFAAKLDLSRPHFAAVAAAAGPASVLTEFAGVQSLVLRALFATTHVSDAFHALGVELLARFCGGSEGTALFGCTQTAVVAAALLPWLIVQSPRSAEGQPHPGTTTTASIHSCASLSSSRLPLHRHKGSHSTHIAHILSEAASNQGWLRLAEVQSLRCVPLPSTFPVEIPPSSPPTSTRMQ